MAIKNVNSFSTTGTISLNSTDSLLGIVNGELRRINNTSLSITPSGLNLNSGTYRINNIPANRNTLNFSNTATNMNNNIFYFTNMPIGASTTKTNRALKIHQNCEARIANWGTYVANTADKEFNSTVIKSTGYFINITKNISGIISDQISHSTAGNIINFGGQINPIINITSGDEVQVALNVPNYVTGMTNCSNSVDVYFYS
jgi:hypothetical protein